MAKHPIDVSRHAELPTSDKARSAIARPPDAPMAFPLQDLSTARSVARPGLFWRLWGLIAQRARL